jgi:hypothetical protein
MLRRSFLMSSAGSVLVAIAIAACDSDTPTETNRPGDARIGTAPVAAAAPKPSAYEMVTQGLDVVSGNTGTTEVLCPSPKKAMGGGFYIEGAVLIGDADVAVYESSPRVTSGGGNASGWRLSAANRSSLDRRFNVYALCATF